MVNARELSKASRALHIKSASLTSNLVMTTRRRFTERVRYALIQKGLVALLLPLGLLFLAFVTHG